MLNHHDIVQTSEMDSRESMSIAGLKRVNLEALRFDIRSLRASGSRSKAVHHSSEMSTDAPQATSPPGRNTKGRDPWSKYLVLCLGKFP